MGWLQLSALIMVLTGFTHSFLGETKLIGPLLAIDAPLLQIRLVRKILRFAWHLTTLLMFATALTILWPGTPRAVIGLIGGIWFAVGLFDGVFTKGQHLGWPMLTLAGLTALIEVV